MGISIFANSIDKLKSIDDKYDSFDNEFNDGRRRILIDKTALKASPQVTANGEVTQKLYFDKNDRTYVAVNGMKDGDVLLFENRIVTYKSSQDEIILRRFGA